MKRLSNYYKMYSLNLHFNKIFKGNAETVKDPFLSLGEADKGVLTVLFSMAQKHYFIKKMLLCLCSSWGSPLQTFPVPQLYLGAQMPLYHLRCEEPFPSSQMKRSTQMFINVHSSVMFYPERQKNETTVKFL